MVVDIPIDYAENEKLGVDLWKLAPDDARLEVTQSSSRGVRMEELLRNEGLKRVRMRLITAVVFVFTLTCSGSFGMEDVVSSTGPGMALLMILILPLVWSVPLAFVSSELSSMIPEAGGLYRWIRRGMGEYWSFQAGWWWTLSLYVDSAVYVAMALDYMQNQWGFGAAERAAIGIGIVAVFTFINMRGLDLTGLGAHRDPGRSCWCRCWCSRSTACSRARATRSRPSSRRVRV